MSNFDSLGEISEEHSQPNEGSHAANDEIKARVGSKGNTEIL